MKDVGMPSRLAQRMDALEGANRVRKYRARMKRQVKAGERSLLEALADPEPEVHTMKAFDLLRAAPKVGRVKANKGLTQARIPPSKTVGGMTTRQRAELIAVMRLR